jgi:hypothetical protein
MFREADTLLTEISDRVDDVKQQLVKMFNLLSDVNFLEYSRTFGERLEYERLGIELSLKNRFFTTDFRWLSSLLLLVIVIAVLFAGVIGIPIQLD